MFSGLIAYNATVDRVTALPNGGARLRLRCEHAVEERAEPKDSIAANGVCLTAVTVDGDLIDFDVIPETLARSNLGTLQAGDTVNLEYSLRLGDRIGGHFVYGHVDATGEILAREREGQGERVRIATPDAMRRYICEKGYVSVDGVSLTVAAVNDGSFDLALIPETLRRTTLGRRAVGERVNLEADPFARYAVDAAAAYAR